MYYVTQHLCFSFLHACIYIYTHINSSKCIEQQKKIAIIMVYVCLHVQDKKKRRKKKKRDCTT